MIYRIRGEHANHYTTDAVGLTEESRKASMSQTLSVNNANWAISQL
jgi:hypothetical protein